MCQESTTQDSVEIWFGSLGLFVQSRKGVQLGLGRSGCRSWNLVDVVHDFEYTKQWSIRVTSRG
jgi:hypothetical protein